MVLILFLGSIDGINCKSLIKFSHLGKVQREVVCYLQKLIRVNCFLFPKAMHQLY